MRINKYLTENGYCSRREADRFVEAGRVKINDEKASLGAQVSEGDKVYVDGKQVQSQSKKVYIMYNKPVGVECTTYNNSESNIL